MREVKGGVYKREWEIDRKEGGSNRGGSNRRGGKAKGNQEKEITMQEGSREH